MKGNPFDPRERNAWRWPDRLKPSEWAQQNRILPASMAAEPGPWRNERTPYLVGVMDAISDPDIETVVLVKAAQIGFSECIRNLLGFWIDHDPGPTLIVMPDQKSAEELIEERIRPMIETTPAVARHITTRKWDLKKQSIRLDTMTVFLGWAGSSQSLKSRPIRNLLLEEPDEYRVNAATFGDPIAKAYKRITTYSAKNRANVVIGGTPTTRYGNMVRQFEGCGARRYYNVPCPHCGHYQRLVWGEAASKGGVKWTKIDDEPDRVRRAARIESERLAWYSCEQCEGRIEDRHKMAMLSRGVWATEDQIVRPDGSVIGQAVKHRRVGFHLSALYSPWVTFSQMASEFVAAQGDVQALIDFINQRLAEPFEEQRSKTKPGFVSDKGINAPPQGIVPKWARLLIASADTQGADEASGYFPYVVRAWSFDYRSQLVDHGVVKSLADLRRVTLDKHYQMHEGPMVQPQILLIDSGGPRWSEVYQFALSDPQRINATKGANRALRWMVEQRLQKRHGLVLWEIDTEQAKDLLYRLMHDSDGSRWAVNGGIDDAYCSQMASEHKVFDPTNGMELWRQMRKDNHYWDCEALQCAAAWSLGAGQPEPKEVVDNQARPSSRSPSSAAPNWVQSYRGNW